MIWADMNACGIDETIARDRRPWKATIRRPESATGGRDKGLELLVLLAVLFFGAQP